MHHHGYLWTGPKHRFDDEALRRPPHSDPPPADGRTDLVQRYKEVKAEFPVVDLPPLESAYWLIKPRELVRGTWAEPEEAAEWLGDQLIRYAPRFTSESDRDSPWLAILVGSAAERLRWGGDVSHGFYLERPAFLSLAVVCCSPNRTPLDVDCPLR
ncbi:hypothetical protein ACFVIM_22155 [Streptomyces sp. NPDC057638]|uniref:hypothetical protein n=1 Tax=Streptomyces sp. NPDC057638 TaxID=3346190 RepID=UPI0036877EB2